MENSFRSIFNAIWSSTDSLTKWIQVIALCIAAGWTFKNYSVADKPSLEPNINVTAPAFSVTSGWEPNTCLLQQEVVLKNEGKISFDVTEVHFRAWHLDTPEAEPWNASFVDDQHFDRGVQIIDLPITWDHILLKHYSPGQLSDQNFTWLLRRQKPGITNLTVEVTTVGGGVRKDGYAQHWSKDVCTGSPP